jgi:hypothetical protein
LTLKRLSFVAALAGVSALLFASVALAAPDNKNTISFEADCEGMGLITVTTIGQSASSVVFQNGQPLVAKRIEADFTGNLAVTDGPTIPLSFSFVGGSMGIGFEDRLVECEFTQEIVETFSLKNRDLRMFELDPEFRGAEASLTATITGTAWVLVPGQQP